ncbi:hypothetical protein B0H14DRAFT_3155587 [Mycena olivaceomarginata]|nr:hypothetical protein B0H14DRAFT_3155587 [Mycena olivaceomarginata]
MKLEFLLLLDRGFLLFLFLLDCNQGWAWVWVWVYCLTLYTLRFDASTPHNSKEQERGKINVQVRVWARAIHLWKVSWRGTDIQLVTVQLQSKSSDGFGVGDISGMAPQQQLRLSVQAPDSEEWHNLRSVGPEEVRIGAVDSKKAVAVSRDEAGAHGAGGQSTVEGLRETTTIELWTAGVSESESCQPRPARPVEFRDSSQHGRFDSIPMGQASNIRSEARPWSLCDRAGYIAEAASRVLRIDGRLGAVAAAVAVEFRADDVDDAQTGRSILMRQGRLGGIGRWSSTTELRVVEKIGVVVVVKRRSLEMRPSGLSLRSIEKGIIGGR